MRPGALIEHFNDLIRESGSEAEHKAAAYIASQLETFGIPHRVYEPDLFLSVPISGTLRAGNETFETRPLSFSISTPPEGITAEVIYLLSEVAEGSTALGGDVTFSHPDGGEIDVKDKFVVVDGFGFDGAFRDFEQMGAKGVIYVNPGQDIHSGICTTIWGAPDLDNVGRQPQIVLAAINNPTGVWLKEQIDAGKTEITLITSLREGWFHCPVIVADVRGQVEPDRFMLVHGHYDSWYEGIGDNAVGDATLLELARIFHLHRETLARSIRFAWWPGHSTGRYAGSTWFVDHFGLDLARNCIAQMNIDSPGCRDATEYYGITWMKEAEDFCQQVIKDTTGKSASGRRPLQAGDYSFNNIGLTGFYMLLSSMPEDLLREKGYYPVGGCGGNIGWHTIHDTFELADQDNLMRDLRVYTATIQRVLNNTFYPFDFRNLASEFKTTLTNYADAAGDAADFAPCFEALSQFSTHLDIFHEALDQFNGPSITDPVVQTINDVLLKLARILIPINYTRRGRFRTEPAIAIPPLPDLAPALKISAASGHEYHVLRTHVQRGINRVAWALLEAAQLVAEI